MFTHCNAHYFVRLTRLAPNHAVILNFHTIYSNFNIFQQVHSIIFLADKFNNLLKLFEFIIQNSSNNVIMIRVVLNIFDDFRTQF